MFKNQMVQMIIDLQKNGKHVYLTDAGYLEFIKLVQMEAREIKTAEKVG